MVQIKGHREGKRSGRGHPINMPQIHCSAKEEGSEKNGVGHHLGCAIASLVISDQYFNALLFSREGKNVPRTVVAH